MKAVEMQAAKRVDPVPSLASRRAQDTVTQHAASAVLPAPVSHELVDEPFDQTAISKLGLLGMLRASVIATAEQELVGSGWTAETCPWIEYWFGYYERRSAAEVEAALRKFARMPERSADPTTYIAPALERLRLAVQRWRASGEIDSAVPAEPGPHSTLASLGEAKPLDSHVRTSMERGFGRDLSNVRVHTGTPAGQIATTHDAEAVAIGSSIAFAPGRYRPGTLAGDALLAHEIAHTTEQVSARVWRSSNVGSDEANADASAMRAVARIGGASLSAPSVSAAGGLALRRCNSKPRATPAYTLEQWAKNDLRANYPKLENISHPPGVRDDGIETETGVRVPAQRGHLLKPRKFYFRREAALLAYQGFIHYAELVEVHHDAAATQIATALYSQTGRQVPTDLEMDLAAYAHWSYKAKSAADAVQVGLMAADVAIAGTELALRRPPQVRSSVGRNAAAGEVDVAVSSGTKGETTSGPKVMVDEPAPQAAQQAAAPKVDPEPTPQKPESPPTVNLVPNPKRGYTGPWPPPEPGPRPPATATEQEMAAWRYKRYLRDSYNQKVPPKDILTPEGYAPHAKAAATPGARPGRKGGTAQRATREGPATAAGYDDTEKVQLGTRTDPETGEVEKNMVDGVRPEKNANGGRDYLEVDTVNKNGLPRKAMREKLKAEIEAMKPGDTLEYWDKTDPKRRIQYKYGDKPAVVDERTTTTLPRSK